MKTLTAAVALIVCLHAAPAWAALPEFGTREGDLACVGLVNIALAGAATSQPSNARLVAAVAIGLGVYLGRLSKVDPNVTKLDVDEAMGRLTLEEKNTYVNMCTRRAPQLIGAALG